MNISANELRQWAERCEDQAAASRTERERMSLLAKAEGLRALADSEDWLEGRLADNMPPAVMRSLAAE